jgi:sulfur relay (sulfurtransferase) complex TusBCD TusD component (DsrE family)
VRHGRQIACCGTCLNTRGLIKKHLIDDATRCYPLALMPMSERLIDLADAP